MAEYSTLGCSDRCHHFYHLHIVYFHWGRWHVEPTQGSTIIECKRLPDSFPFRVIYPWSGCWIGVGSIRRIDKFWVFNDPYHNSCLLWECSNTFLHFFPAQSIVPFILVLIPQVGISRVGWQDNRYKWSNKFSPIKLGCYIDGRITSSVPKSNGTFPAQNEFPTGTAD